MSARAEDNLPDTLNQAAQSQLKSVIERVERLEIEKAEVAEQIKEVFAEAKGNGFDVKILRKVVRIRKQDRAKRLEEEAVTDLYMVALGEAPAFERVETHSRQPEPPKEKAAPEGAASPEDDSDLA